MTRKGNEEHLARRRLARALSDDVLALSDREALDEFKKHHGDPAKHAAAMRLRFEKTLLAANKAKLKEAQAGVARANARPAASNMIPIERARERLRRLLAACPPEMKLTVAARKEDELSDADMLGMLQDLEELGITLPNEIDGQER